MKDFQEIINKVLFVVEKSLEVLNRFKDFFEVVVVYYKYFGGKE